MKSLLSLLLPESIFWRMINANPGLVSMTSYLPCLYLNLELGLACLRITRPWRPFRESADNFLGPKNYFMFAVFAFMMKVSIILIMIEWNYQLKKKNWPVYELQELLLFNRFDFEFAFGPEKLPGLSRNGRLIIFNPLTPDMYTQILYTDLRTFS